MEEDVWRKPYLMVVKRTCLAVPIAPTPEMEERVIRQLFPQRDTRAWNFRTIRTTGNLLDITEEEIRLAGSAINEHQVLTEFPRK